MKTASVASTPLALRAVAEYLVEGVNDCEVAHAFAAARRAVETGAWEEWVERVAGAEIGSEPAAEAWQRLDADFQMQIGVAHRVPALLVGLSLGYLAFRGGR